MGKSSRRLRGLPEHSWVLACVIVVTALLAGCGESTPPAVLEPKPLSSIGMDVVYEPVKVPDRVKAGSKMTAVIRIKNAGMEPWPARATSDGRNTIALAYHWFDVEGGVVVADGVRTRLKGDLHPGKTMTLDALVVAPEKPGRYRLQFDMVQELVAWFSGKKASVLTVPVLVE